MRFSEAAASGKSDGIDILKLDIEGGEAALPSENTGWIAKTEAICAELHDRIVPECSNVWETATAGRVNGGLGGEKVYSMIALELAERPFHRCREPDPAWNLRPFGSEKRSPA